MMNRVLKDGIGEFGKLFFIKRFASSFDSHPKTWKMVSDFFYSNQCIELTKLSIGL